MNELAPHVSTGLRVAVIASDAQRRMQLEALLSAAGHTIVASTDAQAVLCDGTGAMLSVPSVVLGRSTEDHAGQLSRDATATQIDAALRAVATGLIVSDRRVRPREFGELVERQAAELLTPRELEILMAISDGLSNKAIARALGISLHTVKFYVESLFRKLGARTRAEAVARGLERRKSDTVQV